MQLHPMKLVTVVGEEVLRDQVVRKVLEAGATGCSYHSTQGRGTTASRHNDVFSANFQLKCICPQDVAERILADLAESYFKRYAIVAWLSDVEVVREAHFKPKTT